MFILSVLVSIPHRLCGRRGPPSMRYLPPLLRLFNLISEHRLPFRPGTTATQVQEYTLIGIHFRQHQLKGKALALILPNRLIMDVIVHLLCTYCAQSASGLLG